MMKVGALFMILFVGIVMLGIVGTIWITVVNSDAYTGLNVTGWESGFIKLAGPMTVLAGIVVAGYMTMRSSDKEEM